MKKFKTLIIDFVVISLILVIAIFLVAFSKFEWMEATIVCLLIYVINCIFVSFSVINNDTYEEKIAWIFFLILFPIIAHIFYALFRARRDIGISREAYEQEIAEFQFQPNHLTTPSCELSEFEIHQQRLTNRKFYPCEIKLYPHGFDAYQDLIQDLKKAQKFIHIEMYILKPSEIFEIIKEILIKKVAQGVEVKMIVDDFGSWKVAQKNFDYLVSKGIKIVKFNRTIYPFVRHTDNKRLHRKFFVIDGQVVHYGGLNIADEYGSFNSKYGYWADLNFRSEGQIVNEYETIFLYDWFKLTKEKLDKRHYTLNPKLKNQTTKVLLFDEGPNNYDNLLERLINHWIGNSVKSIKIATPYFVPTQQIFKTLESVVKIGVDVEIFIPGLPDKKFVYKATKHYLYKLQQLGVKVKILNNIFLHSKLVIFDDKFAYIGTNNLDMRSLYSNYEAIVITTGSEIITQLNDVFCQYHKISYDLDQKSSKFRLKFDEFLFRILAPLM